MFLPTTMTLKFGDSGDFVAELQRRLSVVGCFSESMVNGVFDGVTTTAVISFQSKHGLQSDGVAGPETLRRLNGVISGDTSSSAPADTKPEETQVIPQAPVQQFTWGQAPVDPFAQNLAATIVAETVSQALPAAAQATAPVTMPEQQPARPEMQRPAAAEPSGYDMLAALVQNAAQPAQAAQAQAPVSQRPPLTSPTAQAGAVPPAPMQTAQPQQQQMPVEAEPQGLMGRAMRFANAVVQKLADYFEAKLPPSVLREVQSIGVAMAQVGVREVPIPAQQQPTRTVDQPARGVEQGQQRG